MRRAAPEKLACAACGDELGPARSQRDYAPSLCLPCLARRPRVTFGKRLRAHRIARGLSRDALAARSEVSASSISRMELGAQRQWRVTLRKLATALGVEPGEQLPKAGRG